MKDTKQQAGYGPPEKADEYCGICRNYLIGSCKKVEGQISSNMWCKKHFERKT